MRTSYSTRGVTSIPSRSFLLRQVEEFSDLIFLLGNRSGAAELAHRSKQRIKQTIIRWNRHCQVGSFSPIAPRSLHSVKSFLRNWKSQPLLDSKAEGRKTTRENRPLLFAGNAVRGEPVAHCDVSGRRTRTPFGEFLALFRQQFH